MWCGRLTVRTPRFMGLCATPIFLPSRLLQKNTTIFPNSHNCRGVPHRSPAAHLLQCGSASPRAAPWRGGALPCKATLAFSGAGVPRRARPHLPSLARGRLAVQGHTCLIDVAASNAGIACRGTTVPLTGGPHRRSTGAAQPCAHCHPPSPPRPSAGSRCAMLRLPVC
jgi:hypothetical protein